MYLVSVVRAEQDSHGVVMFLYDIVFGVYRTPEVYSSHPSPEGESILVAKKRQTCLTD